MGNDVSRAVDENNFTISYENIYRANDENSFTRANDENGFTRANDENSFTRANDENGFTRAVDNAIRSATPSTFGDSSVRSFGSLIDSAIRSSTASTTDADFDLLFHPLGLSGPDDFEIQPAPSQQAQAQQDHVASPPPTNTVNLQQPLLQTEERLNGDTPPLLPLNPGLTSRSGSTSAYDTNSNSRNSSASIYVTSRSEEETSQSPKLKSFSYNVLRAATRNFRHDTVVGEGAFGKVFKCWIDENSLAASRPGTGTTVAVKSLSEHSLLGHKEWLTEITYLGQLQHPNLVRLIGYCLENDYRLLVYEFVPKGSLENHLFRRGSYSQPFPWSWRMNVALGAAKGLAFIHSSEPEVIHRNFKTSNILLDTNYNVKLSGFGLARDGPTGDESHVSTRVMGTCGYAAPEYIATGHLTAKSDVYSFGVVLLEMISGRRAMERERPSGEHNLVDWAKPHLRSKRRVLQVMDPRLEGQYSVRQALGAAALALRCLDVKHKLRPNMEEVVKALEHLQE